MLCSVGVDAAVLGQYEYNALHWRSVKRARSPGAGSLDEMRRMYYSANWQLLEERIDRSWTSGFSEDERAQTFWGKRYIDDAVARRRDRDANGTCDDSFFYVTDAQFSTVAMAKPNGGIVERITYDSYGKARHHFGADVTGDGATTSADGTAIQNAYGNSIGDAGYKAELDLDRDGDIDSDDYNAGIAMSGGVTQSALTSGLVSFVSTGSGGSTRHGPDNPIAWDGYVFNPETSQYLVRFRWYDPVLGRWFERDPLEYAEQSSLYIYARSKPLTRIDPSGLDSTEVDGPYGPTWDANTGTCYIYIYTYTAPSWYDHVFAWPWARAQLPRNWRKHTYALPGVCRNECSSKGLAGLSNSGEGAAMLAAVNLQIARALGVENALAAIVDNSDVTAGGFYFATVGLTLGAVIRIGDEVISLEQLSNAGRAKLIRDVTKSGQAFQKRMLEDPDLWGVFGNSSTNAGRAALGQLLLDDILTAKGSIWHEYANQYGERFIQVWSASGRGARFRPDGSFVTFLSPDARFVPRCCPPGGLR